MSRSIPLLILLLALWLRVVNLYAAPVFVDEGTHLNWARQFVAGDTRYPVLMDGRLLAVAAYALFDPFGPAPLWLARAATAVWSLVNVAVCLRLARALGGRWAGNVAGLLYAVLPYALFHERQALADPISIGFGSLALFATWQLARTGRVGWSVPLGLSLAGAILAKMQGAFYVAVPVVMWALWPQRRRLAAHLTLAVIVGAVSAGLWLLALGPRVGETSSGVLVGATATLMQCPPALCRGNFAEQARLLPLALSSLADMIPPYFGWALVALALIAFGLELRDAVRAGLNERVRLSLSVSIAAVLMLGAVLAALRGELLPRYAGFLAPAVCLLAALAFQRYRRAHGNNLIPNAAVVTLIVLTLTNSYTLVTVPTRAALPSVDERQYLTGPYSGVGFRELMHLIPERETDPQRPPLVVLGTAWQALSANSFVELRAWRAQPALELSWADVQTAFAQGRAVYLLDEAPPDSDPNAWDVVGFERREGEAKPLRLRRYTDETLAAPALFGALFPEPNGFLDQYDQVLAETTPQMLLVAHPQNQASFLIQRPGAANLAVVFKWPPWRLENLTEILPPLLPHYPVVRAVFFEETRFDAAHNFERWLATTLFHEGERYVGPLRVVDWATPAGRMLETWQPDARFGALGILETVEVLAPALLPRERLLVRATYRATAPTAVPYKVFVHLYEGDRIFAQHDAQPASELRPTTGWQPGEVIVDQLSLRLPPDLPPGDYQLRLGLYAVDTQQRLPVTLADGQTAEFVVLGAVTVK
jgi:4-amino-4-deoxy-L-arabinose transferase-like glycosyltransferase